MKVLVATADTQGDRDLPVGTVLGRRLFEIVVRRYAPDVPAR
jgi:hypothetical protein